MIPLRLIDDTFDDNIISFIKLLEKKNLLNKIITNKYQYEKLIEALKNRTYAYL